MRAIWADCTWVWRFRGGVRITTGVVVAPNVLVVAPWQSFLQTIICWLCGTCLAKGGSELAAEVRSEKMEGLRGSQEVGLVKNCCFLKRQSKNFQREYHINLIDSSRIYLRTLLVQYVVRHIFANTLVRALIHWLHTALCHRKKSPVLKVSPYLRMVCRVFIEYEERNHNLAIKIVNT